MGSDIIHYTIDVCAKWRGPLIPFTDVFLSSLMKGDGFIVIGIKVRLVQLTLNSLSINKLNIENQD